MLAIPWEDGRAHHCVFHALQTHHCENLFHPLLHFSCRQLLVRPQTRMKQQCFPRRHCRYKDIFLRNVCADPFELLPERPAVHPHLASKLPCRFSLGQYVQKSRFSCTATQPLCLIECQTRSCKFQKVSGSPPWSGAHLLLRDRPVQPFHPVPQLLSLAGGSAWW